MKKVIVSLLCVMSLMSAVIPTVQAEEESQYKKLNLSGSRKTYKALDLPNDSVKKFSRVSWSTNMVEWLIFAPNVGVEFDLKDPTLISCPSLFLQFSYRPGKMDFIKKENYSTNALQYWRARAEYRWHFRFNERQEQRKGLAKTAMWVNEKMFTKKIEVTVPDTAARRAGDEYATMTVLSKEARIQEKIDSTITSTTQRRTELFPGRYYLGLYGEYDKVTFANDAFDFLVKGMRSGNIYSAGLSGGYDFPGFNYNHKCFVQWTVGASVGLMWFNYKQYPSVEDTKVNKVLPFITELKVAMNFRNTTITKKYWQPDPSVYEKNLLRNHEDSIHMAELDTILEEKPVVIEVTSVNGYDSAFVENIDKNMIVNAFRKSTGLTYLLPTDFNMLEHTKVALDNKELSDNYFIEYVTTNRLRNYGDSVFISDRKNLPFRVQIAGRDEADSLKKSFVDSLKNYYAVNDNTRPTFYGDPATKDSLKGFISKDSIAAHFSRIWGHPLDTSMIRTLYARRQEVDQDGSSTAYYDSVITEQNINKRESYAMFIQFHPQVTLSGEDEGVGRFNVAMAGADRARELYNNTATFMNNLARAGMMLRVERPWNGIGDTFENRVTKEEIMALMKNYGLEGVDQSCFEIPDSIYTYNDGDRRDTIVFNFGVTENELRLPFIVNDSVGRAQALALRNDTINKWKDEVYWDPRQGLYDDDPKVPGYHDTITDEWFVKPEKLCQAINDILFTNIKPYMIDSILWRAPRTPMRTGQYVGKYRAQAKMIFHREIRSNRGIIWTNIPYLIVPVDSKEEAGFIEEKPEVAIDSVSSAAVMRDSLVYTLDSLGNVIDSAVVQVQDSAVSMGAAMRGSFGDFATAAADTVEEVKQLTVAEATQLSKEAAATAKTTAAQAKSAAAAAKKAAADVKKVQKTADATIKKAEKSVNFADSVVVSRDTVIYTLDSIGNVADSTVTTIESKVVNVLDSAQLAAVAERDSIIAAARASVEDAVRRSDSLQTVASEAAQTAANAKIAAAEAKKGIAEAKKAAKAKAAAEKAAAKAAAAEAKKKTETKVEEVKADAVESVQKESSVVEEAAKTATETVNANVEAVNTNVNSESAAIRQSVSEAVETVETQAEENKVMTVAEATEKSNEAAAAAKAAATEAKTAAAAVKNAKKSAAAAQKAAAAALKKVPATAEGEELTPEAAEAKQYADSLQNIANVALQSVDSLQEVANAATQAAAQAKIAAADAKKGIAEAKQAAKAAAAAAKKAAADAKKAEAAAAKAAAAEAKKKAEEEAAAAKAAAETVVEQAVETVEESTEAKE